MPSDESHSSEQGEPVAEGTGETLGKAKWDAVRQLQRRYRGVTGEDVSFEVMEGPVAGKSEAIVRATLDLDRWEGQSSEIMPSADPTDLAREIVSRIIHSLGIEATISIEESEDEINVQVNGSELGLFIGKFGRTIDAVQAVVSQAVFRSGYKKRAVVDAAGYRERRVRALERQADQAVAEAIRYRRPVELDPMRAGERRIIHMHLAESEDVETESDGKEPNRCVVVYPARRSDNPAD